MCRVPKSIRLFPNGHTLGRAVPLEGSIFGCHTHLNEDSLKGAALSRHHVRIIIPADHSGEDVAPTLTALSKSGGSVTVNGQLVQVGTTVELQHGVLIVLCDRFKYVLVKRAPTHEDALSPMAPRSNTVTPSSSPMPPGGLTPTVTQGIDPEVETQVDHALPQPGFPPLTHGCVAEMYRSKAGRAVSQRAVTCPCVQLLDVRVVRASQTGAIDCILACAFPRVCRYIPPLQFPPVPAPHPPKPTTSHPIPPHPASSHPTPLRLNLASTCLATQVSSGQGGGYQTACTAPLQLSPRSPPHSCQAAPSPTVCASG